MIDAAETRRCNDLTFFTCQLFTDANMFLSLIANALFLNCLFVDELIHTFLKDNPGQVTEFGYAC